LKIIHTENKNTTNYNNRTTTNTNNSANRWKIIHTENKNKIKNNTMAQKTKEEQIVFQNQSHLVQKYFNDCGICPDLLDIALATDIMVQFAINGFNKELKERFDNFQIYCNEKYKGFNISQD
jgi:glutaminase